MSDITFTLVLIAISMGFGAFLERHLIKEAEEKKVRDFKKHWWKAARLAKEVKELSRPFIEAHLKRGEMADKPSRCSQYLSSVFERKIDALDEILNGRE